MSLRSVSGFAVLDFNSEILFLKANVRKTFTTRMIVTLATECHAMEGEWAQQSSSETIGVDRHCWSGPFQGVCA